MGDRTGKEVYDDLARLFDIEVVSATEATHTCKQCGARKIFSPCGLDAELREFHAWVNSHFHRPQDDN